MGKLWNRWRGWPIYLANLRAMRRQAGADDRHLFPFGKLRPCLRDRYDTSGLAKGHYFHQDLLVARRIHENRPDTHIDVGSRVDGFVAHVASYRKIRVLDIRDLPNIITNVEFDQCDMMGELPERYRACTDSLSCLHALEHFGLGRYGDPVDYFGYLKGFENLCELLKPGGKLYLSVPIGPQRIMFDAHRVFSVQYLLDLVADRFEVDHFSYVDKQGDLHEDVTLDPAEVASNFGCRYGCGILELTKR